MEKFWSKILFLERDFNIFQVLWAAVSAFLFPGTWWVWTDWGMLGNLLGDFWLRKLIFARLGKKEKKKKEEKEEWWNLYHSYCFGWIVPGLTLSTCGYYLVFYQSPAGCSVLVQIGIVYTGILKKKKKRPLKPNLPLQH